MSDLNFYTARINDIDRDHVYHHLTSRGDNNDDRPQLEKKCESMEEEENILEPARLDFNPYDFGNEKNATSFCGTVVHMLIIAASPTLLNIPATFDDVGYVVGCIGAFGTVISYAYSMHKLISTEYILCKRLHIPCMTYAELIYQAFSGGPSWIRGFAGHAKRIVHIDFLCIWTGGNAIYVVMASQNVKCVYDYMYTTDADLRHVMACLIVPLVLLCWIPNLRLLVVCSVFANVVNACSIVVILYVAAHEFPLKSERRAFGDPTRIPLFLGTIFITINATGMIMPLKNAMRKPKQFSARSGVLNVSYAPICLLYTFFGLICYLRFGDKVKDNVILNMPDNVFGKTMIGFYALGIVCFYPIVSYVSYDIFWNNMLKCMLKKSYRRKVYEYTFRTVLALSSIGLALIVPNIELFVSLTGTVGTSVDSIIFPALAEMLVKASEMKGASRYWLIGKNSAIVLFGLALMVVGLKNSLVESFRSYDRR